MDENKIRGVKVNQVGTSSTYETVESLTCDFCNKRTDRVVVIKAGDDIQFACRKHLPKLVHEMFIKYDDDYVEMCSIQDVNFADKKETKKKVRSEMTLKLRYKIMKRDNFKCTICGKSMPEVELCVDHIIQVCKGGTSEENNLRTLCNLCNAGKGGD